MRFDKIVIEGPNNVGKSTLIEMLKEALGFEVEHVTSLCPNDYEFYDHLLSCDEPLIFDRLHVGEMVYPEIYNRQAKLSQNEFEELCEKHQNHTLTVIIDADFDFIIAANACKSETFNYGETWQEKSMFYDTYRFMSSNYQNCLRFKNHRGKENTTKIFKQIMVALGFEVV